MEAQNFVRYKSSDVVERDRGLERVQPCNVTLIISFFSPFW